MKKLFALAMAALMAGSMAMAQPVFAEETTAEAAAPTEVNWADVEAAALEAAPESQWYTFDEIAVQMWVPNVLINTELTEEDVNNGYIGYFQTEDQSAAIGVQYVDLSGMALEDYAATLPDYGASEIEMVTFNGLPAVSYTLAETDTMAITFMTQMGYAFEVSFSPMSDEGFQAVATFIGASIQPYEEAEGAAEGEEAEAETEAAEESAAE